MILSLPAAVHLGPVLYAQDKFGDSPAAYLGQKPPTETPVVFAPGMLADPGAFVMDRIAISSDGKEMVYCQNEAFYNLAQAKIKGFKFDGGKWVGPTLLATHYYAPTFSMGGDALTLTGENVYEVWRSTRTPEGWSVPSKYLGKPFPMYDFMPTLSGNCYMGSNPDKEDARNGRSTAFSMMKPPINDNLIIQSLGLPLNEPGFNGDFFISRDESFILVSAKERNGGECEIYISYRKPDNTWTNPKSLGPLINDGPAHRWGEFVTADNKYLFYSHSTTVKDCTLYWVRFDGLLERLKHTNFDPYVKNPIDLQTASAGRKFSLVLSDSTFFDDDGVATLTYLAASANGGPLPAWLHFDPVTKAFSGMPTQGGAYRISVTAKDGANAATSCTFSLSVEGNPGDEVTRVTHDYTVINKFDWVIPENDALGYAFDEYDGKPSLLLKRKVMDSKSASIAYPKDLNFRDGIIEFDVASPEGAAGFVGLAFRIKDEHHYETLYFRPGSSDTANAVQYMPEKKDEFNWPDYEDLKYQSLAILPLKAWFHVKVLVKGRTLTVFTDQQPKPVFVYDDLDPNLLEGSVGFWLGNSASGAYKNLVVREFSAAEKVSQDTQPPAVEHNQ